MRLPLSKVHRAFPELDRFTDDQCWRFFDASQRQRPGTWAVFWIVNFGMWVVLTIALGIAAYAAWHTVERSRVGAIAAVLIGTGLVTAIVGLPTLVALFARDVMFRTSVARHLRGAVCECQYSLLGLLPIEEFVRCPECGQRHHLRSLGFSLEEWMTLQLPATRSPEIGTVKG